MTISIERLNILQQTFKATAKVSEAMESAALNDAVTAISELLAVREAQPVFFIEIEGDDWINAGRIPGSTFDFNNLPDGINLLYAAPPAPALPGELLDAMAEVIRISDRDHEAWSRAKAAISACRAAMLQPVSQGYTLNSPVIPDGWKLVPVELLSTASMLIDLCRTHTTLNGGGTYNQRVLSDCEKTMNAIASLLATVPDEIDIFVDQVCGNLPAGHQQ